MASRVPIELYRIIIQNITDRKTLLSLASTSQVLNFEAERALYDTISNIFEVDGYIRVFEHLIACPRVARLVRHLHIILRTHIPAGHHFYTLLSTALHGLPSLKTLVFRGVGECQEAHLPLNSPFQLEHLDWLATSPELPRFLAQQPGLKTLLNVHLTPEHELIALNALHELSTVSGDLATINALLPGRRVKNLHWISTDKDEKNPDVSVLADAFRGLESIRLGGHFHRHPLGLVAEYLSNVTSLELFGVQPDDLGYVCQLPRLEELKLSSQWGSSMNPIPLGDSATIAKLFAGAKTLKRVLVALPVYWPLQAFCQAYEVWHPGAMRPEIVNNGMCL